jgi:hypothetical protein
MTIIGNGQLQHHFWGEYSATIAVKFATSLHAAAALEVLPGFQIHPTVSSAVIFHGGGAKLKSAEAALKAHKADAKKISSLRFSVDHGEPFTVEIDITPAPKEVQQELFA